MLLYNLANRPASFDVVTCIASSMAMGMNHVRYVYGAWKPKDYSMKQAEERWHSIVEPAAGLFGLHYSIGRPEGIEVPHILRTAIDVYNQSGSLGKIPVQCVPKDYITLTLRKSRNPERDSNEAEARKFASRCDRKVIIIPDNEGSVLSLQDRMQLYAGAFMNFMVINGTATLCFHSDAPYVCMRTIGCEKSGSTSPKSSALNGITPGFQFPWANANQKLSYLDDTCENLEFEYQQFCERRMAA